MGPQYPTGGDQGGTQGGGGGTGLSRCLGFVTSRSLDSPAMKWRREHRDCAGRALVVGLVDLEGVGFVTRLTTGEAAPEVVGNTYAAADWAFSAADTIVRVRYGHSCGPICSEWTERSIDPHAGTP
jgi:hypothetical protein